MCEPVSMGIMAAVSIGSMFASASSQRRAQANQSEAVAKQDAAQAKANEAAAQLGPASKAMDLTKEASAYNDLKRNKIAMQSGIMGTMKTNPMDAATAAPTAKATLGS